MNTLPARKIYERAVRLHNRAAKCQSAGEAIRPEKLYLRSLALKEQLFGPDHLESGVTHNNVGLFYKSTGRFDKARTSYLRAFEIFRATLGASHPSVGDLLYNIAQLLRTEADEFDARSRAIQEAAAELSDPSWRDKTVIDRNFATCRLEVRPSRIHRFGVFADEAISADTKIIEYTGQRVSRREWVRRTADRCYLLRLNNYWAIDGSVEGSGAELINHSCEPNCRFTAVEDRMWVSSLRAIAAGEELLIDYRFPKNSPLVRCFCGASACRGSINAR